MNLINISNLTPGMALARDVKDQHGRLPASSKQEITFIDEIERIAQLIKNLKNSGISISTDDSQTFFTNKSAPAFCSLLPAHSFLPCLGYRLQLLY
jgi:hypothetical protein